MKIALVQYNQEWENKKKNEVKINNLLRTLTGPVKMIVFPEMTLTGFTMKPGLFAEELCGDSFNFFKEIAQKNKSDVFAGIIEKDNNIFYNSLIHITAGGVLAEHYRKIHPFSYSGEDKNYSRGEGVKVTQAGDFKTGLSICYDLRFPELYRYYALEKVHLIIVIANWPDTRIEHWRTLLKARAIENQCFVAGVNRVGDDPAVHYNGFSSIFDPMGHEIANAQDEEKIITADLSPGVVLEVRKKLPFLNDIFLIR